MGTKTAILCISFIGWICVLGIAARQIDDTKLIQEIIDALADKRKDDVRDIPNERGKQNDVTGDNRNRYSGNDVRNNRYRTGNVKTEKKGDTNTASGHEKKDEKKENESFLRAIESFLNSERATLQARTWWIADDPSIRGRNATSTSTSTVPPPSTSPTSTTTASTTSARVCFTFWGRRYCFG